MIDPADRGCGALILGQRSGNVTEVESALNSLTTRPTTGADEQIIGEISFRSHTISYAHFAGASFIEKQDMAEHTEWWSRFLTPTPRGHHMFVVEQDASVIGFSMVGPLNDRYEFFTQCKPLGREGALAVLYAMHVDPDHLGKGAGTDLMRASLDYLRHAGFATVVLDTHETNRRSRRFYDAGGWEVAGMAESREDGAMAIYRLQLD